MTKTLLNVIPGDNSMALLGITPLFSSQITHRKKVFIPLHWMHGACSKSWIRRGHAVLKSNEILKQKKNLV